MNKLTYLLIATLLAFALPAAMATDFYVSPDGNDAWSGKLARPNAAHTDGPLASLLGARAQFASSRPPGRCGSRFACALQAAAMPSASRWCSSRRIPAACSFRSPTAAIPATGRSSAAAGRSPVGRSRATAGSRTFPTWQPASGPSPRCGWTASAASGADAERGPLLLHRREGPAAYGPENRQAHGQQPACLSLQSARHSAAEQSR